MGTNQPAHDGRDVLRALQRDQAEAVRPLPEPAPHLTVELVVVPDCQNESAAGELIRTALADLELSDVSVSTIVIGDDAEAARRGFVGSPTILLNDRDPFAQPGATVGFACRVYSTPTGPQGMPALEDLRQAIAQAATDSR
jgi:hypothetical protein